MATTPANTPTPTRTPTPTPQTSSGPPPSTSPPGNTAVPTATPIVVRVIVLPVTPVALPTLAAPAPTQPPVTPTVTTPSCSSGKPLSLALRALPKQVISGQSVSAGVGAPAGTHITARLQVLARKIVYSGTGKHRKRVTRTVVLYQTALHVTPGRRGIVTIRGSVGYRASKPMHGQLVVMGREGCGAATRTAGLTVLPPPPPLAVTLSRKRVSSSGVLAVTIHTAPGAHVSITLRVPGTRVIGHGSHAHRVAVTLYQTGLAGAADRHGLFTARLRVAYKPRHLMTALVSVTARTNGASARRGTAFTVQPRI